MSFICKDEFFFAKIGIFYKSIASNISQRCSNVYTKIFVRRKAKTNYLSNQTWAKCYHSRNKQYSKQKTLDGGPNIIVITFVQQKICKLSICDLLVCHENTTTTTTIINNYFPKVNVRGVSVQSINNAKCVQI